MSTQKSTSPPELVPRTPIVVNGRTFNPTVCIHSIDPDVEHTCVHDWNRYWGNQLRPPS